MRENMKQGAEGGMARENMELQKLVVVLILYNVMVLSQCRNWSGTEMILSYVKLTFKSTWGTHTIQKLAELILSLLWDYPSGRW